MLYVVLCPCVVVNLLACCIFWLFVIFCISVCKQTTFFNYRWLTFTFDIEIHVGGCFVEEPTIEYVGGSIYLLTEIDPDKLSFFEIQDLCHLVGASKEHSRYKYLLP